MSTDQEKSFIAEIRCNGSALVFFDQALPNANFGRTTILNPSIGPGNRLTTLHGHSDFTDRIEKSGPDGLLKMFVYFRCYGDYYNIQIRSSTRFGHFISKNEDRTLAGLPPAGGDTTSFNLLNSDLRTITLDDLNTDNARIYLKARGAGVIKRQKLKRPTIYTYGDNAGDAVPFDLNILERNVPYPTSTTPYA